MFAVRHKHPWNYVVLSLFTACTSYSLGVVVLAYSPAAVMAALALTASAMAAMTGLAWLLRDRDLSLFGIGLAVVGWVFLLALLAVSFFDVGATSTVMVGATGAALFCAYVVFDVWSMLSPWRGLPLDEHFIAAMNIYLDVLNLFLFILQAIGGNQRQ
jgi:hypothetical protein